MCRTTQDGEDNTIPRSVHAERVAAVQLGKSSQRGRSIFEPWSGYWGSLFAAPADPRRWPPGMARTSRSSTGANGWSLPVRAVEPGLITGGRPPGRLRHLRQIRLAPQVRSPKIGRNPGSFTPRCEVSYGRLKPEPAEFGAAAWLRVTPAAGRASPIWERIIKDCAPGNVDPVSGDPRPRTAGPRTRRTIRPPAPRN